MSRKPKTAPAEAGDYALVSHGGGSSPKDWFLARVLWSDAADALIEHRNFLGHMEREAIPVERIRAKGAIAALSEYKAGAAAKVSALEAEAAIAHATYEAAKAKVWQEIGAMPPVAEPVASSDARAGPDPIALQTVHRVIWNMRHRYSATPTNGPTAQMQRGIVRDHDDRDAIVFSGSIEECEDWINDAIARACLAATTSHSSHGAAT